MIKYGSRKFWICIAGIACMVALPPFYHKMGIGESITLMVLGSMATAMSFYTGFNVLEKKYMPDSKK
jgi:hypothetical protein